MTVIDVRWMWPLSTSVEYDRYWRPLNMTVIDIRWIWPLLTSVECDRYRRLLNMAVTAFWASETAPVHRSFFAPAFSTQLKKNEWMNRYGTQIESNQIKTCNEYFSWVCMYVCMYVYMHIIHTKNRKNEMNNCYEYFA